MIRRIVVWFKESPAPTTVVVTDQNQPPHESTTTSKRASIFFLRFSVKQRVMFAKRLSFLIRAGISLVESLTIIRNQAKNTRMQRVFEAITADLEAGHFLSRALEAYTPLFGTFTINIIRIGEQTGTLAKNLDYLADELTKRYALERKVRGALVYPIFISITTLGVTGLLVMYIFPKIMPIFISLNITLPWTTRTLLALSEFLHNWGILSLSLGFAALVVFLGIRGRVPLIQYSSDWLLLHLPIAGEIARSYNCAHFCRTLALNLNAGITLSEALRTTAAATNNQVYKTAFYNLAAYVTSGETISGPMASYHRIFPDMLPHLLLIGETTGTLTNTLSYLSDLYEAEVDESTKNLSNSIEPILLIVMGLLIGLIAISVITPIYEVTKQLGNTH